MVSLAFSPLSVVHVLSALLALASGTVALRLPKGSGGHRYVGWAYVGSMCVVLGTAFRIYTLFGRFGIVHWGAVASVVALLLGVGAAVRRAAVPGWLRWHYLGMGASVMSLYTAFVVESTYRLFPAAYFWQSTLGLASLVLLAGGWLLRRHYPAWARAHGSVTNSIIPST